MTNAGLINEYHKLRNDMYDLIEAENQSLSNFNSEGKTFDEALRFSSFLKLHSERKKAEGKFFAFEEKNLDRLIDLDL